MKKFMEWCSNKDYEQHIHHLTQIKKRKYERINRFACTHRTMSHNNLLKNMMSETRNNNKSNALAPIPEREALADLLPNNQQSQEISKRPKLQPLARQTGINTSRMYRQKTVQEENSRISDNFRIGRRLLMISPVVQSKQKLDKDYRTHLKLLKSISHTALQPQFRLSKYFEFQDLAVNPSLLSVGHGKHFIKLKIHDIYLTNRKWEIGSSTSQDQTDISLELDTCNPKTGSPSRLSLPIFKLKDLQNLQFAFRFRKGSLKINTVQAPQQSQCSQDVKLIKVASVRICELKGNQTIEVAEFWVNVTQYESQGSLSKRTTEQLFTTKTHRSIGLIDYQVIIKSPSRRQIN